jgi:hypothetical protein
MGTGEALDRRDVRRRLPPEVADVVLNAMDQGCRVRALGHGVQLYCPCGDRAHRPISINGTPRDASREAGRGKTRITKWPCWPKGVW